MRTLSLRFALATALLIGSFGFATAQQMSREQKREIFQKAAKAFENPVPSYKTLQGESFMSLKLSMGFLNLEFESTEKIWHDKNGRYRAEKEEFNNFDGQRKRSTIVIQNGNGWEQLDDTTIVPLDPEVIEEKLANPFGNITGDDDSPISAMLGGNTPDLDSDELTDSKLDSLIYKGTETFEGHSCHVFELLQPAKSDEKNDQILFYLDQKDNLLRGAAIRVDATPKPGEEAEQNPFSNIGIVTIKATVNYHGGTLGNLLNEINLTATSENNSLNGSMVMKTSNVALNQTFDDNLFDEPQAKD